MANDVSHAALPYPIRGCRYTLLVPYINTSGVPTDPTTPDTEVSKDAGAFADCVEEVTTITGSNGQGYITLTGDETDCSLLALAAKVTSGPNTTLATLYPRVLVPFTSGTIATGGNDTIGLNSNAPSFDIRGCIIQTTSGNSTTSLSKKFNQARFVVSYNTMTRTATVAPPWESTNLPSITMGYTILINENAPAALYANITSVSGATIDGTKGQFNANLISMTGMNFNTSQAQFGANIVQFTGVQVDTTKAQFGVNVVAVGSPSTSYSGVLVNTSTAQFGVNIVNVTGVAANHKYAQFGTNIIEVTGAPANHRYEQFGTNVVNIQPNTINAAAIAPAAIDDATYAADTDKYQAKIWLLDDNTGTTDRYAVCWFKNGQPITTGITSPTIQVIKAADGTDLIASAAMTEIGALGLYKYEAVTTERITSGSSYIAKVTATIGGSSRTWYSPVGRDT